jgi:hypothetical protein
MAAIFLNDVGGNPYILAEEGVATIANVKVRAIQYREMDTPAHEAVIFDGRGRLVASLTEASPTLEYHGWVNGLTVNDLPSGYVVVSLVTN